MHCARCGFTQPGQVSGCPSCGHLISQSNIPIPVRRPKGLSPGTIRSIVYSLIIFGGARGFGALYDRYLAAEQERVEAVLLGQALEHKKQLMLAAQDAEPEAKPGPATSDVLYGSGSQGQ